MWLNSESFSQLNNAVSISGSTGFPSHQFHLVKQKQPGGNKLPAFRPSIASISSHNPAIPPITSSAAHISEGQHFRKYFCTVKEHAFITLLTLKLVSAHYSITFHN
jgi:hypothetical protein